MLVQQRRKSFSDIKPQLEGAEYLDDLKKLVRQAKKNDSDFQILFSLILEERLEKEKKRLTPSDTLHVKILLVLQNEMLRKSIQDILLKRGHVVQTAESSEVIALHHSNQFSLMIFEDNTEVQGVPDGLSLCSNVRRVVGELVVILVVTQTTSTEHLARILDAGASDYIIISNFCNSDNLLLELRFMSAERQVINSVKARQAESLKWETKKLLRCFEKSGDSIEIWDRQGRIQYINQVARIGYSRPRHELLGKEFTMFLASTDLSISFLQSIQVGETWGGRLVNQSSSGAPKEYNAIITPITSANEDILCFLVVKREETAEKKIAEMKQKEQEKAQQRELMRLSLLSYNIHNLMSQILGLSDILSDDPTFTPAERINLINQSATSLMGEIKDLLDIFQIETGKLDSKQVAFSLPKVLEELLDDSMVEQATSKGIEVSGFVHPDIPDILIGNIVHFKQILSILISNAIRLVEKKIIPITYGCNDPINNTSFWKKEASISFYLLEQTNEMLMIKVETKDTGLGFAKENIPHLFHSFKKTSLLHSNLTPNESGKKTLLSLRDAPWSRYLQRARSESFSGRGWRRE